MTLGLTIAAPAIQSALFNFQSLLLVILLLICTCAYVHDMFPSVLDRKKDGPMGVFWKCARIGERLSPYISICCVGMAVSSEQTELSILFDSLLALATLLTCSSCL